MYDESKTREIFEFILKERAYQEGKYPGVNDHLADGTGPEVTWLHTSGPRGMGHEVDANDTAESLEILLRVDYETFEKMSPDGRVTWMHLVREEIAEAFQESDPVRLFEELVQVAALAISWLERLRAREKARQAEAEEGLVARVD